MASCQLLDGSLLKDVGWFEQLITSTNAVALYQDLGEDAMGVGPWLVPTASGATQGQLEATALPQRHGISTITTQASLEQLVQHLHQIRHIQTDDGQSFYLRYADTRTLSAITQAWPAKLQAAVKGPIDDWQYTDRYAQPVHFANDAPQQLAPLQKIKLAQFEALINAGQADRIALELQEFNEADLQPVTNAAQFSYLEQAIHFIEKPKVGRYSLQIEIARQAVLTQGRALLNPQFIALIEQAMDGGDNAAVTDWKE